MALKADVISSSPCRTPEQKVGIFSRQDSLSLPPSPNQSWKVPILIVSADPSSTVIVAWWGAILSTVIFVWDIYKHVTAGPKLRIAVRPGVVTVNMPEYDGKRLVSVTVTNYGDRPTTLTNLEVQCFKKRWRFRKKIPDHVAFVKVPNTYQQIPCELKPGAVWTGFALQGELLEAWAAEGDLFMVLYHSHSTKPIRQRVIVKPKELSQTG